MKRLFRGIPLADIAGMMNYPEYRIIFKDGRPSKKITLEDAKVLAAMWGYRL